MKTGEFFMKRALKLARRGAGNVFPNPMVGAVIAKNGAILAEAWHARFGGAHAERAALEKAAERGADLHGATLYTTLEPCVEFDGKKTRACAPQIAASGISRVVCAMADPNPRVTGKGVYAIRRSGISVEVGLCRREAARINQFLPFVALKAAVTLDGKIATASGDSKWITHEASRKRVKKLRDEFDAVLVGAGTVKKDNPSLGGSRTSPLRVILDSKLSLSPRSRVLRDRSVLLVTTRRAPPKKIVQFQEKGFAMKIFPRKIPLVPLLRFLVAEAGVSRVLVEGGAEIFGSFLDAGVVNRLFWFISPKIIGGRKADRKSVV